MTKRRGEEFADVRSGNVVIVVDVETVEEREGGRVEAAEGIRKKRGGWRSRDHYRRRNGRGRKKRMWISRWC